jgi:hypothetical protein
MNEGEFFEWFRTEVLSRWPRLSLTTAQLGDWFFSLCDYEPAVLTRAVRRHYIDEGPTRPKLTRIREIIRDLMRNDPTCRGIEKARRTQIRHFYLECIDHPEARRIGAVREACVLKKHGTICQKDVEKIAGQTALRYEKIYGGKWLYVTDRNPGPVREDIERKLKKHLSATV